MQWEYHHREEVKKHRSSKSVMVLLNVLAGNSLLSERHGCVKNLTGKATAVPLERSVFLVPISKSELWDGNYEGVHGNRDVCCRVEGGASLDKEQNKSFSFHTYVLNN